MGCNLGQNGNLEMHDPAAESLWNHLDDASAGNVIQIVARFFAGLLRELKLRDVKLRGGVVRFADESESDRFAFSMKIKAIDKFNDPFPETVNKTSIIYATKWAEWFAKILLDEDEKHSQRRVRVRHENNMLKVAFLLDIGIQLVFLITIEEDLE